MEMLEELNEGENIFGEWKIWKWVVLKDGIQVIFYMLLTLAFEIEIVSTVSSLKEDSEQFIQG